MNFKQRMYLMFCLPLLLVVGWWLFRMWGLLVIGVPLLIIETELMFYGSVLRAKKEKWFFNVIDEKETGIGVSLILLLSYLGVAELTLIIKKHLHSIIGWFNYSKWYILITIGIIVGLFILSCLLVVWFNFNKKLAEKHLGKKRIEKPTRKERIKSNPFKVGNRIRHYDGDIAKVVRVCDDKHVDIRVTNSPTNHHDRGDSFDFEDVNEYKLIKRKQKKKPQKVNLRRKKK